MSENDRRFEDMLAAGIEQVEPGEGITPEEYMQTSRRILLEMRIPIRPDFREQIRESLRQNAAGAGLENMEIGGVSLVDALAASLGELWDLAQDGHDPETCLLCISQEGLRARFPETPEYLEFDGTLFETKELARPYGFDPEEHDAYRWTPGDTDADQVIREALCGASG